MKNIVNKILVTLMFVVALAPYFDQRASETINNHQTINVHGREVEVEAHENYIQIDGDILDEYHPDDVINAANNIRRSSNQDLVVFNKENLLFVADLSYKYSYIDKTNGRRLNTYGSFIYNKTTSRIMYCIEPNVIYSGPTSGGESKIWTSFSDEQKQSISRIVNVSQNLTLNKKDYRYSIAGQILIHQLLTADLEMSQPSDINNYINEINTNVNQLKLVPSFNNTQINLDYNYQTKKYEQVVNDTNQVLSKYYPNIDGVTNQGVSFKVDNNQLIISSDNKIDNPIVINNDFYQGITSNIYTNNQAEFINSNIYQDAVGNLALKQDYSFSIKTPLASINGLKTDDESNPLSDVEFELYIDTNNSTTLDDSDLLINTVVTNEEGIISFDQLPLGNYIIKETKSKQGYINNNYEEYIQLTTDKQVYKLNNNRPVVNPNIRGTIIVNKTDEDKNPLSGVEFCLYSDLNGNQLIDEGEEVVNTITTNEHGVVEFKDIKYGDYVLKETKAKEGYLLEENSIAININENNYQEQQIFDIVNKKINLKEPPNLVPTNSDSQLVQTSSGQLIEDILFIIICVGMIYLYRIKN